MTWKINGLDLDNAAVKVIVTPNSLAFNEGMRRQDIPLLHDTMKSHLLGRNLPAWKFRFEFVGASPDRYIRLLTIRNQIRGFATFELEAPSTSQVVFEDNVKSITLSMVNLRVSYGDGVDMVVMEVDALHVDPEDTSGLGSGGVMRATTIVTPIFRGRIKQPIVINGVMTVLPDYVPQVGLNRGVRIGHAVTAAQALGVPSLSMTASMTAAQSLGAPSLVVSNTVTVVPTLEAS